MMKYRLTRRGKWVLYSLGFSLVIITVSSLLVSRYHDRLKQALLPQQTLQEMRATALALEEANRTLAEHLKAAVFFQPDQADIGLTQVPALDSFLKAAQTLKDYPIVVEGNCADVTKSQPPGMSQMDSIQLSSQRAEAVAQYLEVNGITMSRITLIANGSDKPSKDNRTLDGQAFNRRADVYFGRKDKE